jgi:hypothetical protein
MMLMLSSCVMAACSGSSGPTSSTIVMPLSETVQTGPFIFHFTPGDSVETERELAFHDWATTELGVKVGRPIALYKYENRQQMGALTGNFNTNAYSDPETFAVHTLFPFDNHEPVHLYTSLIGSPVGLWNEGIAVALQTDPYRGDLVPRWSGEPLHEAAARLRATGQLVPIQTILETEAFAALGGDLRYIEAGSFVRFLWDQYGLDRLKRLFRRGDANDSKATVSRTFEDVYGRSISDVEHDWLAFLDSMPTGE